jgi:hypothetical protein
MFACVQASTKFCTANDCVNPSRSSTYSRRDFNAMFSE